MAVTAALAQRVRIPTRRADAGAALAESDQEGGCRRCMPVHDGATGNREGGEGATATGGGGVAGGEEEEDEVRWRGRRRWWGCVSGGLQW